MRGYNTPKSNETGGPIDAVLIILLSMALENKNGQDVECRGIFTDFGEFVTSASHARQLDGLNRRFLNAMMLL